VITNAQGVNRGCGAISITVTGCSAGVNCCSAGYYLDNDVCSACTAGTYSRATGASNIATCLACSAGTYSAAGSSSCSTACVAGTYGNSAGACLSCPSGTYSTAVGALTMSTCSACPAGSFSLSSWPPSSCLKCASGTYSPSGASSCTDCASGSYAISTGSTSCAACGAGTYSTSPSQSCKNCAAGTYSTSLSATSISTCLACAKGSYSSTIGAVSAGSCIKCVPGTYLPYAGAKNSTSCISCTAGTYSATTGAVSISDCSVCLAGSYSSSASSSCTTCYPGSWSPSNSIHCTDCLPGTYNAASGSVSVGACTGCPAGTYSSTTGASSIYTCSRCPPGTYSSTTGASSSIVCLACPVSAPYSSQDSTSCSNTSPPPTSTPTVPPSSSPTSKPTVQPSTAAPTFLTTITTVAGYGVQGYSGDGGQATAAQLSTDFSTAVDASGNIYIADAYNHRIRMVTRSTGIITTVAGGAGYGYSGDGGQATAAQLSYPQGVAVDASGNIYIADSNIYTIRMVTRSTGIITTVAGGAGYGYSGDGGQATAAQLSYPQGVAVDASGNIYIADAYDDRIRMVTRSTGIITTVAGGAGYGYSGDGGQATAAQLNRPKCVAVDASGNIYIADAYNHRIRMVTRSTGIITTVAGIVSNGYSGDGGQATAAQLSYPQGVAVDASGNIYIADAYNHRIRMVTRSTGIIATVAGGAGYGYSGDGGQAAAAKFRSLKNIAVDASGNIYIADTGSYRIRMIGRVVPTAMPTEIPTSPPGTISTTAPSAGPGQFTCPAGMFLTPGTSCAVCPAGTSSESGSTTCTPCAAGSYSGPFSSGCALCSPGYYATVGSSCSPCLPGTYSELSGSATCTSCPSGQFSGPSALSCTLCSA
jgi:sugar lactone lactonase YvrE